jgi:hypothetical protein
MTSPYSVVLVALRSRSVMTARKPQHDVQGVIRDLGCDGSYCFSFIPQRSNCDTNRKSKTTLWCSMRLSMQLLSMHAE